jgi:3-hydroxyisobutyrate dehydrogenase
MAERLLECGCTLAVWNRTLSAASNFESLGAVVVAAPVELWDHCEIVLSNLKDDQAVLDVFLGTNGLLGPTASGKAVFDTSTVLPDTAKNIAREAGRLGCEFLDSPVLGTVTPARLDQLIAMVGGTSEGFARIQPVLDRLTRKARHLGPAGTGSAMKLSVNIPMIAYWAAFSESMAVAARYGLRTTDLLDIIGDSPAALAQLPLKLEILASQREEVGFPIDAVVELLQVIRRAAGEDLDLPVTGAAIRIFALSAEVGAGGKDVAAVARHSDVLKRGR